MIEVENLTKEYKGKFVLRDINWTIGSGVFGLLGENGAGKSTFLKLLATLLEPTSGRIIIDGKDLGTEKSEVRKQLGYLPQEFDFYSRLTGFEMLDYFAVLKGMLQKEIRHDHIYHLMTEFNLLKVKDKRISNYSYGMKQRLGIIQAMLGDPKLLILDEPTVGLDLVERNRIHNIINKLGENRTIIYSTHIFADIEACCTDVSILHKGDMVFHDCADKLATGFSNITEGYIAMLKTWKGTDV